MAGELRADCLSPGVLDRCRPRGLVGASPLRRAPGPPAPGDQPDTRQPRGRTSDLPDENLVRRPTFHTADDAMSPPPTGSCSGSPSDAITPSPTCSPSKPGSIPTEA